MEQEVTRTENPEETLVAEEPTTGPPVAEQPQAEAEQPLVVYEPFDPGFDLDIDIGEVGDFGGLLDFVENFEGF